MPSSATTTATDQDRYDNCIRYLWGHGQLLPIAVDTLITQSIAMSDAVPCARRSCLLEVLLDDTSPEWARIGYRDYGSVCGMLKDVLGICLA